jgi:hypothetical protein
MWLVRSAVRAGTNLWFVTPSCRIEVVDVLAPPTYLYHQRMTVCPRLCGIGGSFWPLIQLAGPRTKSVVHWQHRARFPPRQHPNPNPELKGRFAAPNQRTPPCAGRLSQCRDPPFPIASAQTANEKTPGRCTSQSTNRAPSGPWEPAVRPPSRRLCAPTSR